VPLAITTFTGVLRSSLDHRLLVLAGFGALLGLLVLTMAVFLGFPRMLLTRALTKEEAHRHVVRHGGVRARSLPLRIAWKKPGTWRRAGLWGCGPYRLATFRSACRRLAIPEPESEYFEAGFEGQAAASAIVRQSRSGDCGTPRPG